MKTAPIAMLLSGGTLAALLTASHSLPGQMASAAASDQEVALRILEAAAPAPREAAMAATSARLPVLPFGDELAAAALDVEPVLAVRPARPSSAPALASPLRSAVAAPKPSATAAPTPAMAPQTRLLPVLPAAAATTPTTAARLAPPPLPAGESVEGVTTATTALPPAPVIALDPAPVTTTTAPPAVVTVTTTTPPPSTTTTTVAPASTTTTTVQATTTTVKPTTTTTTKKKKK